MQPFKFISKIRTFLRSIILRILSDNKSAKKFRIGKNAKILNASAIKLGKEVNIGQNAVINCFTDDGDIHLEISDNVYIGRDVQINAYKSVKIQSDVVIADRVHISDATHNHENLEKPIINQGTSFKDEVEIGSGSWLGINSVILPGVKLGKNVIVAANSVVSKDVEDFCVVGGVPAKFIKKQT